MQSCSDSTATLDADVSIELMGVDSLVLSQLRAWISKELGLGFPMMQLLNGPSPRQIAKRCLDKQHQRRRPSRLFPAACQAVRAVACAALLHGELSVLDSLRDLDLRVFGP